MIYIYIDCTEQKVYRLVIISPNFHSFSLWYLLNNATFYLFFIIVFEIAIIPIAKKNDSLDLVLMSLSQGLAGAKIVILCCFNGIKKLN